MLRPLGIEGEIGSALMWAKPIADRVEQVGGRTEAQYGAEVYWRLLVFPQLWVTPGAQIHVNPTFNTRSDFMFIPHIKSRLFI